VELDQLVWAVFVAFCLAWRLQFLGITRTTLTKALQMIVQSAQRVYRHNLRLRNTAAQSNHELLFVSTQFSNPSFQQRSAPSQRLQERFDDSSTVHKSREVFWAHLMKMTGCFRGQQVSTCTCVCASSHPGHQLQATQLSIMLFRMRMSRKFRGCVQHYVRRNSA